MQTIMDGTRGLHLLFRVNMDRLIYIFAIWGALWFGTFMGSL